MAFTVSCNDEVIMKKAECYIKKELPEYKKNPEVLNNEYSYVGMYDLECEVTVLKKLQEQYQELDIFVSHISEVEGRDSSWWGTTTYRTETDSEGKRALVYVGGSTCWA